MRVLLLSRYASLGASSQLRSNQYLPYFSKAGFDVIVASLFREYYVRCVLWQLFAEIGGVYDHALAKSPPKLLSRTTERLNLEVTELIYRKVYEVLESEL